MVELVQALNGPELATSWRSPASSESGKVKLAEVLGRFPQPDSVHNTWGRIQQLREDER
jgi:hypothetical protein